MPTIMLTKLDDANRIPNWRSRVAVFVSESTAKLHFEIALEIKFTAFIADSIYESITNWNVIAGSGRRN